MAYCALVIEDDATIADVLRMRLARDGHEVAVAPSQQEAYHLLDNRAFDFALLDLRLPTHAGDMSPHVEVGFDTLTHIRARFPADRLPVIVMTAFEDTSQTAVRSLKAGANDYITKPFHDSPISLDDKLRGIVAFIGQARLASAAPRPSKAHSIVFFLKTGEVEVDGIPLKGLYANLVWLLGRRTLTRYLDGSDGYDPRMPGKVIADAMGVKDATVRRQVARFRKWLAEEYKRRGLGSIGEDAVIRNTRDWKGYDLNDEASELSWR
jgi:DNA-binding response OmpR family regulator